jgi:ParB-like chromosome segregation protein Spo0J
VRLPYLQRRQVPLGMIQPLRGARTRAPRPGSRAEFEYLVKHMQEHGQLNPVLLYANPRLRKYRYQVLAGARRVRAALRLGWPRIAAEIVSAEQAREYLAVIVW